MCYGLFEMAIYLSLSNKITYQYSQMFRLCASVRACLLALLAFVLNTAVLNATRKILIVAVILQVTHH